MHATSTSNRLSNPSAPRLAHNKLARFAPLPLRLIVGFGFVQHGYAKLHRGPELFAATLHGLSVPAPHLMAWITILIELVGGLAVLLGLFLQVRRELPEHALAAPLGEVLQVVQSDAHNAPRHPTSHAQT